MRFSPIRVAALTAAMCIAWPVCVGAADKAPESETTGTLRLTIVGLHADSGHVMVALSDSAEGFRWPDGAGQPVRRVRLHIEAGEAGARAGHAFADLPFGTYAIKLFHDRNDNGTLDTNLFGVPTEPYGFSNNARRRFGPPPFAAAKFAFTADDQTIEVRVE